MNILLSSRAIGCGPVHRVCAGRVCRPHRFGTGTRPHCVRSAREDSSILGDSLQASSSIAEVGSEGELEDCIEDLMVSWFAYQNESLLAAQALVETIIAAHRSGWSVERVNMELSFLSLKKQDIAGQQIGALDNDMLLSFVAVGIYTCQEVYCSRLDADAAGAGAGAGADSTDATLKGLQQYVRQTLQQYTNGATLGTMLAQQGAASATQKVLSREPAPQMKYMQNLTRVVLQTIETLQQQGQIPARQLLVPQLRASLGMAEAQEQLEPESEQNTVELQSTGLADNLDPRHRAELLDKQLLACRGTLSPLQARWLAVKLLLAFMGATMGWAFSYQVFVDTALLAYLSGASVSEISSCLKQHEFSQAGALLQAASDETARSEAVNADAYCRWLSTTFATWALLRVPHAKAGDAKATGWGWAGPDGDQDSAAEAHRMAEVVSKALQNLAAESGQGDRPAVPLANVQPENADTDLSSLMASARQTAIRKRIDANFMVAKIDDPSLRRSSSATTYMMQQLGLVRMAKEAVVDFQQRSTAQS